MPAAGLGLGALYLDVLPNKALELTGRPLGLPGFPAAGRRTRRDGRPGTTHRQPSVVTWYIHGGRQLNAWSVRQHSQIPLSSSLSPIHRFGGASFALRLDPVGRIGPLPLLFAFGFQKGTQAADACAEGGVVLPGPAARIPGVRRASAGLRAWAHLPTAAIQALARGAAAPPANRSVGGTLRG